MSFSSIEDKDLKEQEHLKRVKRLKQVRTLAKDISLETLSKYQNISKIQWEKQLNTLFNTWLNHQNLKLAHLNSIKSKLAELLGQSHFVAVEKEQEKIEIIQSLISKLGHQQQLQVQRSGISASHFKRKEMERMEVVWMKKKLLESIHTQENLRARFLVDKYKATKALHVSNIEISSNTVQARNLKDSEKINFDSSCYHREHSAIKCIVAKNQQDVRRDAVQERMRAQAEISNKMHRKEILDIQARARYQLAINSVAMDQKKEKMIREMTELQLQDRLRKQTNASIHATSFRPTHPNHGPDKITSEFKSIFQIEANGGWDGGGERQDFGKANIPVLKQQKQGDSSFEFVAHTG